MCGATEYLVRGEDVCLSCKTSGITNPKGRYVVGVDPDIKKPGFAIYDRVNKELTTVKSITFFEIFDLLTKLKDEILLVRIEAGWLNRKSNFHSRGGQSKQAGEKIAEYVGRNHEVSFKLIEACKYIGVPYEVVRPLGTKNIDAAMFKKITGWPSQTNPDNRDAGMLCYGY